LFSPDSLIRTSTFICRSWARFAKDTYETASRAALVGGTTTLIEMCAPSRADDALAGFELWMKQAVGKSACDFTFHMSVTKFDDKTEGQLREIVKRGISSFKVYLAYKGAFGVDDTELYRTLKLAKELGVIVTAHCENETLIAERAKELLAAGKTDSGQHHESRPPQRRGRGRASFDELCRTHRRGDLHRAFELQGSARPRPSPRANAACA
jgi:dihydropyrimidinase